MVLGQVQLDAQAVQASHRPVQDDAPLQDPYAITRAVDLGRSDQGHIPLIGAARKREHPNDDGQESKRRGERRARVLADEERGDLDDELTFADRVVIERRQGLDDRRLLRRGLALGCTCR